MHFFGCCPHQNRPPTSFHCQNKTKWSDMATFLFSVHTITEAKQYAGLEPGWLDLPARSFDLAHSGVAPPLTIWDTTVTVYK